MASVTRPISAALPAVPPWRGWAPLAVLPAAVVLVVPGDWPAWALLWLLAAAVYAGFKWLTWRRSPAPDAPWWRHAAYVALWPGMDSAAFLGTRRRVAPVHPMAGEWLLAAGKLTLGLALLWLVAPLVPRRWELVLGWIGMTGIVFVLHFGSFHLLSCLWRSLGVDARPLMHWPVAATSLSDFWGRRWNTAFRDLTHRFLFAPLRARVRPAWALAAGFLFSGVVHDLVISLPAGGGWGGPTLYFAIQGAAVLVERSRLGRWLGLARGWRGWTFTMFVLLAPVYALFHPPFLRQVVIPFLEALGATSPEP